MGRDAEDPGTVYSLSFDEDDGTYIGETANADTPSDANGNDEVVDWNNLIYFSRDSINNGSVLLWGHKGNAKGGSCIFGWS